MEYDITSIHHWANDNRGHNVQFRVSVPPSLADAMQKLASKGSIPGIDSPQDVFRDGAYHRLHWYVTEYALSDEMAPIMELVEAERKFALLKKHDEMWKQILRDIEDLMQTRRGTYSEDEVRSKVEELYEMHPPDWAIAALDDIKSPRKTWRA